MDRQTLRWLAFSFGVRAAHADQARFDGMSKGFVVLSFRCFVFRVPVHFLVVACGF